MPTHDSNRSPDGSGPEAYLRLRRKVAKLAKSERLTLLSSIIDQAKLASDVTVLRSTPLAAPERSERVHLTLLSSKGDSEFLMAARAGDQARDNGEWESGATAYSRCLSMYPYHHGYLVQRSHCLKEVGRYTEAEIGYRDALALGAPWGDVQEHLSFTAVKTGFVDAIYPRQLAHRFEIDESDTKDCWRDKLSTSNDILILADLFYGVDPRWSGWVIVHLRAAPRRIDLVCSLIQDSAFARANRRLLRYLSEL